MLQAVSTLGPFEPVVDIGMLWRLQSHIMVLCDRPVELLGCILWEGGSTRARLF